LLFQASAPEQESTMLQNEIEINAASQAGDAKTVPQAAAEAGEAVAVAQAKKPRKPRVPKEPKVYPEACHSFLTPASVEDLLPRIAAACALSIDLETTSLTPWTPAGEGEFGGTGLGKLGTGEKLVDYLKRLDCEHSVRPRARILTIGLVGLRGGVRGDDVLVFDLDAFDGSPQHLDMLLGSLHGKTWYGHNLAFDTSWLLHLRPTLRPARIVDSMLVAMTYLPELLPVVDSFTRGGALHAAYPALGLDQLRADFRDAAASWVRQERQKRSNSAAGEGRIGLDPLAQILAATSLDKSYQKPHNWMQAVLTKAHYDYCAGDVVLIPEIVRRLLGLHPQASEEKVYYALDSAPGAQAYAVATRALVVLAGMQRKGLRIDQDAAEDYAHALRTYAAAQRSKLEELAPDLKPHLPGIFPHEMTAGEKQGLTTGRKEAFAAALRATGVEVPVSEETGEIALGAKALRSVLAGGASDLVSAWSAMWSSLKQADQADDYAGYAAVGGGRVHSLIAIGAATLRTTSQAPNLQNVPRGADFRALFRAAHGHKIVSADYSAIEMRVAAALGVRAYEALLGILSQMDQAVAQGSTKPLDFSLDWIFKLRENGSAKLHVERATALLAAADGLDTAPAPQPRTQKPIPGAGVDYGDFYFQELYRAVYNLQKLVGKRLGLSDDPIPLREVFRAGIDVHLATALPLVQYDTQGKTPSDYLCGLSAEEQDGLKATLKGPRQNAKGVNFGTLYHQGAKGLHNYGITNYGLSWDLHEAAESREIWLSIYPELDLWHVLSEAEKIKDKGDAAKRTRADGTQQYVKDYISCTLSGRPVCASTIQGVCNYQDQGSAAEIAHRALVLLEERGLTEFLVGFVHDEFLLEVPAGRAEDLAEQLVQAMRDAAGQHLDPWGVPVEIGVEIGDHWTH
jgi:DNA polymerase-1